MVAEDSKQIGILVKMLDQARFKNYAFGSLNLSTMSFKSLGNLIKKYKNQMKDLVNCCARDKE